MRRGYEGYCLQMKGKRKLGNHFGCLQMKAKDIFLLALFGNIKRTLFSNQLHKPVHPKIKERSGYEGNFKKD